MMYGYKRFSTVGQMVGSVAVFAALALVLESGGLYQWAQRLELGPERTVALPLASRLHRGLGWLGLERFRRSELVTLARAGWSDDPEALAEAKRRADEPAVVVRDVFTMPSAKTGTEVVRGETAAVKPVVRTPMLPLKPMAGDPPLVSVLPKIAGVQVNRTRTVALTGDSMMAVGLSSAILREASAYKDLAIVKTYKSGTGLARPEVFNWQSEYPAMLKSAIKDAKPDVVLVAIGANDGQGFVEDGVTYPFGTPEWQAIYQRRVQAFLDMLEADGAKVVWIGLPPMKSGVYDSRIALVNRIDYAVVSASPQAIWFSSAGLVGDASGHFQDYGQVRGTTTRLRQADGIHLSDDGAVLLTSKLLPWLAKQEAVSVVPNEKETASLEGSR
jgi:hypothetical protein